MNDHYVCCYVQGQFDDVQKKPTLSTKAPIEKKELVTILILESVHSPSQVNKCSVLIKSNPKFCRMRIRAKRALLNFMRYAFSVAKILSIFSCRDMILLTDDNSPSDAGWVCSEDWSCLDSIVFLRWTEERSTYIARFFTVVVVERVLSDNF